MTVTLIAVNVFAFVWELGSDEAAIVRWAVVPAELPRGQGWITPLTAMFHGGVMHIISNMLFLAAFAPMVEHATGRRRFLVFYLLGGLAATAAQTVIDPVSAVEWSRAARDAHRTPDFISSPRLDPAPAFSEPTF